MNKSKLLDIFRVISPNERRLFLEYVQSPYFNKREDVVLLCSYLIKKAKEDFPFHKLKIDFCWPQLFPDQKFDGKKMAYLMSRLCHLAEKFLGQRYFEEENLIPEFSILKALVKHRLEKHYQQNLKIVKKIINKSKLADANHIKTLYELSEIEDFHFGLQNQREFNFYLNKKNDYLDEFFSLKKLQIFCNLFYQQMAFGKKQKMTWPQAPNQQNNYTNTSEVYAAYFRLYQLLLKKKGSEEQFLAFKSLLPTLKHKLSHLEYIDMFSFAINYCLLEINKGKRAYITHLLSLYENGLSQGSLLVNNELSPWMYKNIVKLGLGLKRFKWTEDFIQNYTTKLPEGQRKDAYHFNLANLNYYQKNYDPALEYLNQVEFTDVYYKHGAKAMLLKIYFEKNETEAFFALESSFKILLMRDKQVPGDLKTTYLNFIRFTGKLYKLKYGGDKHKLEKLRLKIEQTPNINGRNWVIGQMEAVK